MTGSRDSFDTHPYAFISPGEVPIRDQGELRLPFVHACKRRELFRIGAEAEKFGVDATTRAPLHYEGVNASVQLVLRSLMDDYGWAEESESPGSPIIALRRGEASVTLEPGSQLELSGSPLPTIHGIANELVAHLSELRSVSSRLNVTWLGVGFHPFAKQEDLDWVPKARYAIMREYLPTRGQHGLDMMRRTATVQANFDYSSEVDAMRKLRLSLKLSPLTTAMFANSPFVEGRATGEVSHRAAVWLDVDPDRSGLVPGVWNERSTFDDYIEWALDAPMFMVKRGKVVLDNRGQSFRDFLTHGFQGHRPSLSDWETHLNTMFPEVRLKRTLEVRGADSLPTELFAALPALWTGILYDDQALSQAEALVADFRYDELVALRRSIPQHGLRASFRESDLGSWAEQIVEIAMGGLERRGRLNREGRDERVHLDPLAKLVARRQCPADVLLQDLGREADPAAAMLARTAL